jgi:hypothetical protein
MRLWKPWADGVSALMEKRGLGEALSLGMAGDIIPSREQVEFWKTILPGARWVVHGHGRMNNLYGMPVAYSASVFGCSFPRVDPAVKRYYGWQRENITTQFARYTRFGSAWNALTFLRLLPEWNIAGNQNGVGRLGADFFEVRPGRDPRTSWKTASVRSASWLSPGENGAIPTADFLIFREGIQECEARIFLEKILTDEGGRSRLGDDLARRAQELLDERTRHAAWILDLKHMNHNSRGGILGSGCPLTPPGWYAWSGWQERSGRLYALAAEAAKKAKAGDPTSGIKGIGEQPGEEKGIASAP